MTQAPILDDEAFDRLMAPFAPFERRPVLAVAVSGGADSMALVLLAARWAARRKGTVLALTVDHGLRPEAADEARQVGRWLKRRRIAHEILAWIGPKPRDGLQAAARAARYALLLDRCRARGILHLLLAHHRDDQAETVLLRLAGGSGPDGLAAMAPVTPADGLRLLRPLLTMPKTRLEATLTAMGQDWIEDPSNRDIAYGRVRLRRLMPALGEAGLTPEALATTAAAAADRRRALDEETADLLARACVLSPAGYARLDARVLRAASPLIARRALDRIVRTVGGAVHGPRGDRLDRLWSELGSGPMRRRSLGGCLVMPEADGWLIHREPAALASALACRGGEAVHWDQRFILGLAGRGRGSVAGLGQKRWPVIRRAIGAVPVPNAVAATLPALFDAHGDLAEIPHLGWRRPGYRGPSVVDLAFAPASPLTGGLVWHGIGTMC
jgi:tRNA(Ile)-lysidine synthase